MSEYPSLFDVDDLDDFNVKQTIEEKFWTFHNNHPEVYRALVVLARQWIAAGHAKLGIKTLIERLRWEWHVSLKDGDGYKLNNNYAPLYARLIMSQEPDLDGLFDTRVLASERVSA